MTYSFLKHYHEFVKERGFAPIFVLVAIVAISVVGSVIYFKSTPNTNNAPEELQKQNEQTPSPTTSTTPSPKPATLSKKPLPTKKPTISPTPTSTPTSNSSPGNEPTPTPTPEKTCYIKPNSEPTPPPGNLPQTPWVGCMVSGNFASCKTPATANFIYGAVSRNNAGYVTNVQWDFDGDGTWDTPMDISGQRASHTYDKPGSYTVRMQLQTSGGLTSDICTSNFSVY